MRKPRILLCCSGSVATIKIPELYNRIKTVGDCKIVLSSKNALFFLQCSKDYNSGEYESFNQASENQLYSDCDEWSNWKRVGDLVLHIELRKWADIVIVAPASANTLSQLSYGLSSSLMLSIARAWDFRKPCLICPAMNTLMFSHPSTVECLSRLQSWGWQILDPATKPLACGDYGKGALPPIDDIISFVQKALESYEKDDQYEFPWEGEIANIPPSISKENNILPVSDLLLSKYRCMNYVLLLVIFVLVLCCLLLWNRDSCANVKFPRF